MTRFRLLPLAFVSALALTTPLTLMPQAASAQVDLSITVAPPLLPIYAQPPMPAPDYLWTPGYWAWGTYGYFWVPGTWVEPPQVGLLWTPGWWGWESDHYFFHIGYWGPTVGFYGGVNYGFGYNGGGYYGGHWDGGHFFYNRAANNFGSVHITNVYNAPVAAARVSHVSFNGGHGGLTARPNQAQQAAANQHHVDPTSVQTSHQQAAAGNYAFLASVNHGRPAVAATSHPSSFSGAGVVQARNHATYHPAAATTNASAGRPSGGATPTHTDNAAAAHPDNASADHTNATTANHTNAPVADHAAAAHPSGTAPTHAMNTGATHTDHAAATPHTQQAAAPAATPHPQAVHTTPSHPAPVHATATPHPAPASHPAPVHQASAPAHPAAPSHPAAAPAKPAAAPAKPDDSKDDHH